MALQSHQMNYARRERRWLSWWGGNGKLALRWSCWLNRQQQAQVEKTFLGLAQTRRELLINWTHHHWQQMILIGNRVAATWPDLNEALLRQAHRHLPEVSELFVVDVSGRILLSTAPNRANQHHQQPEALKQGLQGQFLHGPYPDPLTGSLGPTTSQFHDDVTLMFYQPLALAGAQACLCARIPNDVMSDLIQREAGHVYRESGDNYLFMVESRFDRQIQPGTALSRSRFEDDTFSGGDNLKQGIRTPYGKVQVKSHTEFEIHFTDPATGKLHPGVRETIRHGKNLFVLYPGYPDYRHIPVIGSGITLQLPGSPDLWGMMCEGDLAEVYQERSISYALLRLLTLLSLGLWGSASLLLSSLSLTPPQQEGAIGALLLLGLALFWKLGLQPCARRLQALSNFFLETAECGVALDERLAASAFTKDETGVLSGWINSFVDKIDITIRQIIAAGSALDHTTGTLRNTASEASLVASQQNQSAHSTANAVNEVSQRIEEIAQHIEQSVQASGQALQQAGEGARSMSQTAGQIERLAEQIEQSSQTIDQLNQHTLAVQQLSEDIGSIAEQTNLLALNAAIESARAGEHGRGFAVVADEVRNLASHTAQSTIKIAETLTSIRRQGNQAVDQMQTCQQQARQSVEIAKTTNLRLEQIHQDIAAIQSQLGQISEAMQYQRQQTQTANDQAQAITQGALHSANSANSTQQAAYVLEQLVLELQQTAGKFCSEGGTTACAKPT